MNKKKLILIAEDDISIRTVLSTELENKYELKLTDNCAQLWNWVSDGLGDMIILDVMMPDENGLNLIPKIKKRCLRHPYRALNEAGRPPQVR